MAPAERLDSRHRALDPPRQSEPGAGVSRRVLTGVRAGWPLIVILVIVGSLAGYVVSSLSTTEYQASARVFLDPGTLSANGADPVRGVATQAELAVSPSALADVAGRVGLSERTVQDRVTAVAAPTGNYFTVTGTGTTPDKATALVTAAEGAYLNLLASQLGGPGQTLLNALESSRVTVQQDYDAAVANSAAAPGNAALKAKVAVLAAQLQALNSREGDALTAAYANAVPVQLVEQPARPTSPVAPTPRRDALLGAVAGLLLAVALLWWRSDRLATVRTADVEAAAALPRIATLPRVPGRGRRKRDPAAARARDVSYADVALAVDLAAAGDQHVLLLVGCRPGDLAPQTALGIARAFSRDRRVVLVDGDQQHAELTRSLTAEGITTREYTRNLRSGFVALPAQEASGDFVFVPVQRAPGRDRRHYFSSLMADLRDESDLVIVTGPAPDATPMAGFLAISADAALILATPGTPLARIVATRERMAEIGRPILGYVVDRNVRSRRSRRSSGQRATSVWEREQVGSALGGEPAVPGGF